MKVLPIRPAPFHHHQSTREIWIVISLIFFVSLTELHSFVYKLFPETYDIEVDYFLSPNFKLNLRLLWYLKMNTEDLLRLNLFVILILLAPSRRVLWVFSIYFVYFVIDFFLFLWNFKETAEIYWFLLAATVLSILIIFVKTFTMATSVSRSELTRLFTLILVILTTLQAAVPGFPIDTPSTKAIVEAVFMFLVVGLTAWKQYLSVEIRNAAIFPTLAVALIAILGGLNDLIEVVPLSHVAGQWVRLGISTLATILSLISKTLWPTQESKIIEQTKSELTPPPSK